MIVRMRSSLVSGDRLGRNQDPVQMRKIENAMIEEVRTGPLFSGLKEEQLERMVCRASRISLEEGQLLFREGDVAERFYLVLDG